MKKTDNLDKELVKNEESLHTFEANVKQIKLKSQIKKIIKMYCISLLLFLISYILYK